MLTEKKQRRRFDGNMYFNFQTCENAIRCNAINELLDSGRRVFGDTENREGKPPVWVEIYEAIQPYPHGLEVRLREGLTYRIYGYNASDEAQSWQLVNG